MARNSGRYDIRDGNYVEDNEFVEIQLDDNGKYFVYMLIYKCVMDSS